MKKFLKIAIFLIGLILIIPVALYFLAPVTILNATSYVAQTQAGVKNRVVYIDGIRCNYLDNGAKDKETLVLVHGFTDGKESWFPFANEFSDDYRIVALDLLGHGKNVKYPNLDYSFSKQAQFLKKFIDELSLSKPHLIGASMGGAVTTKFAIDYPDELISLTIITAAGINGNPNPSKMNSYMTQFETVEEKRRELPILPNNLSNESLNRFKSFVFSKNINIPNKLFKHHVKHAVEHKEFYLNVMRDFIQYETGKFKDPLDDELYKITCPVLVIWGMQDPLIDPSSVIVFQDSLPNMPVVKLLDDCGHAPSFEKVKETRSAIVEFLGKKDA